MNVLSLFDGISCGQIALDRANVSYSNYYASEIDKHVINVTQYNYPNTIQLGDIRNITGDDLPSIDLLFGGFPCQSWSQAGKKLGFEDNRGLLFYDLVRLKNKLNPKWFLIENVKMDSCFLDIINKELDCTPIEINSNLVSAQGRPRLYWTNIPFKPIIDKKISWDSISDDGWYAGAMRGRRINGFGKRDDYNKDISIKQYIESRLDDKTNCLTTVGKDNIVSEKRVGRTILTDVNWRYMSQTELEKLQTLPIGYTKILTKNQASKAIGNCWTVDIISHILRGLL